MNDCQCDQPDWQFLLSNADSCKAKPNFDTRSRYLRTILFCYSLVPHLVYFLQRMCTGHVGAVWRIQHCAGPSAHPACPVTRLKQIRFPAVACVVNFAILHRHLAGVPDVPSIHQLATAEKEQKKGCTVHYHAEREGCRPAILSLSHAACLIQPGPEQSGGRRRGDRVNHPARYRRTGRSLH